MVTNEGDQPKNNNTTTLAKFQKIATRNICLLVTYSFKTQPNHATFFQIGKAKRLVKMKGRDECIISEENHKSLR
ncbi:hypothetical protein HMPREF0495_01716 [Levilactobacillus brevis ATCC 14869 = DSM 20054]|uniref:Uncharacterized protein n=1 Tax=Levilactobacillus brevis ATCC 14869 = DSM 20054 TaxID=649758 RepID=U2NY21_LEVBR|nr:hypothetical protein HMPREF0495_01716 [Levilactobacillus brevis ATCC 14869 = DSM 20054]